MSPRRRQIKLLRRELAKRDDRDAKRVLERDAYKSACHRHASRRGDKDWSVVQRALDSIVAENSQLRRQLAARDPQQRRAMRREQKRRAA